MPTLLRTEVWGLPEGFDHMFLECLVQLPFSFDSSFLFLLSPSPLSLLFSHFLLLGGGGCSPLSPPPLPTPLWGIYKRIIAVYQNYGVYTEEQIMGYIWHRTMTVCYKFWGIYTRADYGVYIA